MIKTFRGLLNDGQQERIRLETLDGKIGYKIVKFQLMPKNPTTGNYESVVKVFSIEQTVVDTIINFSEQTLLAAGTYSQLADTRYYPDDMVVVFDSGIFNQDIFVTHKNDSAIAVNYYLELETVSLDDVEATAVILKNFRNTNTTA